jgi:hypothetical protein
LRLSGAAYLAPTRAKRGEALAFGVTRAGGPTLLPETFLRRLRAVPPRDDVVELGALRAYRYIGLRPRGLRGRATLYASATTAGAATVACVAPDGASSRFLRSCERIVSSLELIQGKPRELGPGRRYLATAERTMLSIRNARFLGLSQLLQSSNADKGKGAARIAAAYRRGTRRLERATPGLPARDLNATLVTGLRRSARAYTDMAAAAGNDDAAGWDAARRRAAAAYVSVTRTLERIAKAF